MIFRFAGWSSGRNSNTLSTAATDGSCSNAARFRRSSTSEVAEDNPATLARLCVAMIRRSHVTDSVPFAWRFRRL